MVGPDKSRYIYLYSSSAKEKQRYEELAKKADVPLSKFLLAIIEEALNKEPESIPRSKIDEEIRCLKDETRRLYEELRLKNIVLEKYELELKQYRNAAFIEDDFEGARRHDQDLIGMLKQGPIHDYRLMEVLNIDLKDSDMVRAITKRLEDLEAYGLIAKGPRGWRWVG
jgi:hypothetical protein